MQSGSDAPVEVVKQPSVAEINCPLNGKENCMTDSSCLQEKQASQNAAPQGQKRSKLPVLSKAKEPPDFQKMHQTWQTHFQKGKAICKKSCTRPQPFNFSQRRERPRRPNVDVRTSMASSNEQLFNSPGSYKSREPLAEVILRQNKKESSFVKGDSEVEFKSDPSALASILSNTGVSAAPVGKVSLAQRVPMRGSSNTHPCNSNKNSMIRNSMYCVSNSQIVAANLDRMSCFSKMTVKATEQKPPLRPQSKNPILETTAKLPGEQKKEELHPQENAVLQQMNPPTQIPTSDKTSCLFAAQDDNLASLPAITDQTSSKLSTHLCKTSPSKLDESTGKKESEKKTDNSLVDFVADSHSLANILSNSEINNVNCGKLSLAQRVPMQGRSSMFKGAMPLPGFFTMQTGTPKSACGSMSNVAVPLKELMFSPCRVPLVTSEKGSGASARRAFRPQSSTMKFPQHYSATSKQPVFPKTPRALALEKANKCLEADKTDVPTLLKSTVKWADELSPSLSSEVICEREPDMEEVAMRLFLDGEGPEEPEKKKEPTAVPDPLTVLESPPTSTPEQNKRVQPDTLRANVGDSQNIQLHSQMHLAPLSQPSASYSSSSVTCQKPSVPLSFLTHPAVKALQSSTSGPCSLPDIARLRLQAAVSAKQRFWEARLDEECAFYISRGASGSNRSCRDPVSLYLEKQEDMHFTPICSGES